MRATNKRYADRLSKLSALAVSQGLLLLMLAGCTGSPLVTVTLLNRTGGACQSVQIDLNGKSEALAGNVANGNADITGGWPYPMPSKATLRWVTDNATSCSATLNIPAPSPARADFLNYEFVLLPAGRAKVAVVSEKDSSDMDAMGRAAERAVAIQNDLGRDGGPNYRVAVKNTTGMDVEDVDVRFGPYTVNAGTQLSATGQNYSIATGLPYPVTSSASLRWITKDGQVHTNACTLRDLLPPDLNGKCLWFLLRDHGDATVQIVAWSDLRAGKHPDLCHGF
jgi:hypothetical protein